MKYKQRKKIYFIVILALVFAIYGHTLTGDFVFDDRSIVSNYPLLSNLNNLPEIVTQGYWTDESGLYRPVVLFSYSINASVFGPSPFSFHLVNIVIYVLVVYFLFVLLRKLFKNEPLAALTALIFLVLPIHSEVVANVIGRAELLALLFSLLALIELAKKNSNPWLIGLWAFLAIGSKEHAMAVLPLALLIALIICRLKINKEFIKRFGGPGLLLLASGLFYLALRAVVLGPYFLTTNASLVENPLKFASYTERFYTALKIMVMYIGKSFVPYNLCSDYSYNQIPIETNPMNWQVILGLGILAYLAISMLVLIKKAPILSLGSGFFLLSFLPVSNFVFPIGTIAGERLAFFPSVGLAIYLATLLYAVAIILKKKTLFYMIGVITIALVITYSAFAFIRSFDWLNEKSLFTSAGECASSSVLSVSNLGTVYYFDGDYDQAEETFNQANKIYDKYSKAINNLGLVYWKKGEYDKARSQYFKAIKNWPPYEGVYENLILLYLSQDNKDKARKWVNVIMSNNPEGRESWLKQYGLD